VGSNPARRAVSILIVVTTVVVLQSLISFASSSVDHGGYRPHYQGYGVTTPGGRGGTIIKVTNLNDSGPGSLRAAMEARGPRIVIFEVSGTISLNSSITLTSPFLTVAGQTAPSPGITVRYAAIRVATHDVVVQHLRVRLGDTFQSPGSSSAFYIWSDEVGNSYNVVLDHMSLSWGTSTLLSVIGRWRQIAVLDSLFAFNLRTNGTETGPGAHAAYWHEGEITYARNLFVHNSHRQPWFGAGARASAINNVMYGNGNSGGDKTTLYGFMQIMLAPYTPYNEIHSSWNTEVVAMNNRFIPSYGTGTGTTTGTHPATKPIDVWLDDNPASVASRLYLSGNVGPHMTLEDQWVGVDFIGSGGRATLDYGTVPAWHANFGHDVIAPGDVTSSVFANAGARPADRDSVDTLAVKNAIAGLFGDTANMGTRITSQSQMGGWPVLAQNHRALRVPANPHGVAPGESFRTNIEVWLEAFARELEAPRRDGAH
jgi:hypothetical protein